MDIRFQLNIAGMATRVKNQVRSFDPTCIDDSAKGQPVDFARLALSRLLRTDDGGIPPSMDIALLRMAICDQAVQLLPHHLEAVLMEAASLQPKAFTATAKLRTKLRDNPIDVADLIQRMADLPPMFVKGLECRLTGVCDFCDMCVVISNHTRLPCENTFRFFGGSFGHAAVVGGVTPFKRMPLNDIEQTLPFRNFGIREDEVKYFWRPEKAISQSDIRKEVLDITYRQLINPPSTCPPSPSYNPVSPTTVVEPSAPEMDFQPIDPAPVVPEVKIAKPKLIPPLKPKRALTLPVTKKESKIRNGKKSVKKNPILSAITSLVPRKKRSYDYEENDHGNEGSSTSSAPFQFSVVSSPTRP